MINVPAFQAATYGLIPALNSSFSLGAAKFLAVGYPDAPNDWTRQMGLISPRHIIYATHYPLTASWKITFFGSDGLEHKYGLESQTPLINAQNQQTDMMLVTLSEPVTAPGVTPFRFFNLATEANYINKPLLACGSVTDSSTTILDGFTTLSNDPGFDTTRFAYFDYNRNNTQDTVHKCNVRPGDSGGPVFVMENNEPAIIGAFSSSDDLTPNDHKDGPAFRSYVSSIPAYATILDTMMEAKGYHLKRFYPDATTLTSNTTAAATLRQMKAGSVNIQASNTGSATAHNVAVKITFSQIPTSVAGSGWICEAASPLVWNCRRGGLNAASAGIITANWTSLPAAASMQVTSVRSYDGGSDLTFAQTLPLLQTYTSWIQDTSNIAKDADPDRDGITNLLEYAFGGSPTTPSPLATGGHKQLPQCSKSGNYFILKYPRRTDEAARLLTSTVQYASSPAGPWVGTMPAGTVVGSAPFSPVSTGFEQVTVTIPTSSGKLFVRVKEVLDE